MKSIVVLLLFIGSLTPGMAQSLTGYDIMVKHDEQLKSNDESATILMKLIDKKGRERVRNLSQEIITLDDNNRSTMIRFISPADVRGTGFLSIENTGRDNDQWLYLPALRKSRRISASDQTDNFVGSDFTYEDIEAEDIEAYEYKLIGSKTVDDQDYFLIEAFPGTETKKKETGYSKRELYLNKENFLVMQVKFYDKNGEYVKNLLASEVKLVQGTTDKWRANLLVMKNLNTEHTTRLEFSDYKINVGLDADLFTFRYLERGN